VIGVVAVPYGVVTWMVCEPADLAGAWATIEVSLAACHEADAVPPNVTAVAAASPEPERVTVSPPLVQAVVGDVELSAGGAP